MDVVEQKQLLDDDDIVRFQERKRWLFFGLPWTFTKYTMTDSTLTINQGFFNTVENDCYMYKVQDVKLTTSLWERLFKLATITCYTGDVTNSEIKLIHIKNAKNIKTFLLKASEVARIKRRTVNMLDIGTDFDMDNM